MNHITVHTREKELELRYARDNNTATIRNGEFRYLVDGMWVDQDSFDILYPVPVFVPMGNGKGQNICRKHEWRK